MSPELNASKSYLPVINSSIGSKVEETTGLIDATLPDEVIIKIFNYLGLATLVGGASLVSKKWNRLTKESSLWRNLPPIDYLWLANHINRRGNIQFPDGTVMTQQELYLKTIELDPRCVLAYSGLAATLPQGGSIKLPGGTVMTQQALYVKAIELDPRCRWQHPAIQWNGHD
jgi:hypothetical protein